jgi:hypothetical protein
MAADSTEGPAAPVRDTPAGYVKAVVTGVLLAALCLGLQDIVRMFVLIAIG